jgi:hypothetical protein
MISDKMFQLKQDISEVKGKFEDMSLREDDEGLEIFIDGYKDLKEAIEMLEEHLKDHIEDVENFVGRF